MTFFIVAVVYTICHGTTAWVVFPLQNIMFPDITVYASLIYFPHGIRVLATWLLGWRAIPPLTLGAVVSAWLFNTPENWLLLEPAALLAALVGASSAYIVLELARVFGYDFYFDHSRRFQWRGLIAVGTLASVLNSIGTTLIFSLVLAIENTFGVLVTYLIGDLFGLILCMIALMFIFRWGRKII